MIHILLGFWIIITVSIVWEQKVRRLIIYLGIFSLVTSVCYLVLGSPDVAMAEAVSSAFTVLFFIVCFEKYYNYYDVGPPLAIREKLNIKAFAPLGFTVFLFGLILYHRPGFYGDFYLRDRYLEAFIRDVGGENPVTAIYLGYRVYDTLFEALVVVICVIAAIHLSEFGERAGATNHHSEMENSGMAVFAIQVICSVMLLFGVYLMLNGHITPGGGFQGGLAVASFFICRYMIYDVNDLPIRKLNRMEELVFVAITLFAASIVFFGAEIYLPGYILPIVRVGYMFVMNVLIGLKVACGFIILFYRFIVIEQR